MAKVFEKTKMLTDVPFHYCPGCTHGIAHRLVAEVLEERRGRTLHRTRFRRMQRVLV